MGLPCVSLVGFMVRFGGIHFNFLSLGKQDSTVAISARKNRSWHERAGTSEAYLYHSIPQPKDCDNSWYSRGTVAVDGFHRFFIFHFFPHKFGLRKVVGEPMLLFVHATMVFDDQQWSSVPSIMVLLLLVQGALADTIHCGNWLHR
jgi:hypothetical protein